MIRQRSFYVCKDGTAEQPNNTKLNGQTKPDLVLSHLSGCTTVGASLVFMTKPSGLGRRTNRTGPANEC